MQFEGKIRNFIETKCEDYFLGTVDLSRVDNSISEKYDSLIAKYPRAISIGVTLPYFISEELHPAYNKFYNKTNCQLKYITSNLSRLLENEGYQALTMPKSTNSSGRGITFHETVASLADMGKIEKNHLITPEVGSKVNWGTVLTNAPI